ncbi:MAG: Hsp70 family protein [Acidobacteriota bacterium]|nr:heat shock 70 family protein [Blastocatellia bacterium]MDW8413716.1 Hsp70 family protein [Acidobacteriota bacterium]
MKQGEWIGIAVGNEYARVAVYENGQTRLVPLEEGDLSMPSAVLLHRMREVGKYAYLYSGTDSNLYVSSIGRLLGKRYVEVKDLPLPVEIVDDNGRIRLVGAGNQTYSPVELYAMVLQRLKYFAERYLGHEVEHAVLTVAGSTNDFQRRSVRLAAAAVFKKSKLINEPAAAALPLMVTFERPPKRILTFDMGAGKCEAAVLELSRQGQLYVKAIVGDTDLGGNDIDLLIYQYLSKNFARRHNGVALANSSQMARHEVMMAVKEAKHRLEQEQKVELTVPFVSFAEDGKPLHLVAILSQRILQKLISPLVARAQKLVERCLSEGGSVDEVILLGGCCRMQVFKDLLYKVTGKNPINIDRPEELAVRGAAIYAGKLNGASVASNIKVEDVTAHSLGITLYDGSMGFVLKRQTIVPATTTKTFETTSSNLAYVVIEVREGENIKASDNRLLGEFRLPLPPNLPARSPIKVTIGKDEDGIVVVRATDPSSGNQQEITITYDL